MPVGGNRQPGIRKLLRQGDEVYAPVIDIEEQRQKERELVLVRGVGGWVGGDCRLQPAAARATPPGHPHQATGDSPEVKKIDESRSLRDQSAICRPPAQRTVQSTARHAVHFRIRQPRFEYSATAAAVCHSPNIAAIASRHVHITAVSTL